MASETFKFGLFAYELVDFCARNEKWAPPILNQYRSFLNDSYFVHYIGDAALFISDHQTDLIYNCYDELDNESVDPRKDFTIFALDAVPLYFPDGYTPEHFLGYCAITIGVAIMFFDRYCFPDILDAAAEVIQSVLSYFALIGDFDGDEDIPELVRISRHCVQKLRRKLYHERLSQAAFS